MNQVTTIDPFADVFPGVFRGFVQPGRRFGDSVTQTQPLKIRMDVTETETAYVVHAEMPGVTKENIDVKIDGAQVSVSAKLEARTKTEGETVLREERYSGEMSRVFTLASEIDEDAANARFENGVLELTLPKKVAAAARRLAIN